MKVCALILARGGSKSIPNKNIRPFNGTPLICHCLQTVTKCNFFCSIWVSTDCSRTSHLVQAHYPQVAIHHRSTQSAHDASSSIDSVKEFVMFHDDFDAIALIQCTSPCLVEKYLREAFDKLASGFESVFSAYHDHNLRWSISHDNEQLTPLNFDPKRRPRRQDIAAQLVESGHFYFATKELIMIHGLFQSSNNGTFVVVPEHLCIELDSPYQWPVAELMATLKI